MKQFRISRRAVATTLMAAAFAGSAAAQVVGDSACPAYAVDIASFATCDGDRVARAGDPDRVSAGQAFVEKYRLGEGILLVDVRSRAEAALAGWATATDAIVPWDEIAHPYRWDPRRNDLARVQEANFVEHVDARVAALGADRSSRLLLMCRTGEQAMLAARTLLEAGFINVAVIDGGFEGRLDSDGRRRGGWKDQQLPWTASLNGLRPLGLRD